MAAGAAAVAVVVPRESRRGNAQPPAAAHKHVCALEKRRYARRALHGCRRAGLWASGHSSSNASHKAVPASRGHAILKNVVWRPPKHSQQLRASAPGSAVHGCVAGGRRGVQLVPGTGWGAENQPPPCSMARWRGPSGPAASAAWCRKREKRHSQEVGMRGVRETNVGQLGGGGDAGGAELLPHSFLTPHSFLIPHVIHVHG